VIAIRRRKLPDPAVLGNAGSFFKNPIVPAAQAEALKAEHDALPVFRGNDETYAQAVRGWLIDHAAGRAIATVMPAWRPRTHWCWSTMATPPARNC
jgi:UDP-N-acetylenolpyruvoylglucosamine reductase